MSVPEARPPRSLALGCGKNEIGINLALVSSAQKGRFFLKYVDFYNRKSTFFVQIASWPPKCPKSPRDSPESPQEVLELTVWGLALGSL